MTAAIKQTAPNPREVAVIFLAKAKGDVAKATRAMTEKVREDAALFRVLMDPLVEQAVYDAIRAVCRADRRRIWNAPTVHADDPATRVRALSSGTAATLLNMPLPGGKRLGLATRAEVSEAAEFYLRQASNMSAKGQWLRLIAQAVPDGVTVKSVITEARLNELRQEAGYAE